MKVLVLEYITGGGLRGEALPASFAREGEFMLHALVNDLLSVEGVELTVLRDDRLPPLAVPRPLRTLWVDGEDGFRAAWQEALEACESAWPIAPETAGILEALCGEVLQAGRQLLNCGPDAVRLAASKRLTAERLKARGLPGVPTQTLAAWSDPGPGPWVLKPDDGVGCQDLRIVHGAAELLARKASGAGQSLVQPWVEGDALSLSVLMNRGDAQLLSCNRQVLEARGSALVLLGCEVNLAMGGQGAPLSALAQEIAAAFPELWGYVGVDLIMTEAGPLILELNPRLTTSYAGLHAATGVNPAALVLSLARTGELPVWESHAGRPVRIDLGNARVH